jgi:tetratricopeptide (TPR) repeat protein
MPNAARAPKIIEMPLKRSGEPQESFVPASLPSESPAAIAARKLEALAHFHLALEEYEEALDAFRRLLKLVPVRADLLVQTVACMERLEKWQEGAELLQPEVEQHPDWTEAALALGICRLHLNQPQEALDVFRGVESRSPGNQMAKEGIRAAQALLGPPQPDTTARPANWEHQLHDLASSLEWERLIKTCEPLVAEGEPTAHFFTAYALEQMGNTDFAIADYEKCLEASPNHREARYNLACILIAREQYDSAAKHLAYLTSIDSENSNAWWNYMLAAETSGRHEEAIAAAQHLIRLDGFTPELRFRLGLNCLGASRYEEAVRHFNECCEENEYWSEARINLALAMQGLGNMDQARAILENALREQPASREAAEALIGLEIEQGNMEDAVSLFETLQNRGIPLAPLSMRIARAFEDQNEIPAAMHYYERALRADPSLGDAFLALAELLDRSGKHEEASACRKMAVRVDPSIAKNYFE